MSNILKIVLCTFAFIRFFVTGESIDDLKQKYAEIIMTCANDFPLTVADLQQLRAGQLPDDQNIKCLFACAYKKIGMCESIDDLKQKYAEISMICANDFPLTVIISINKADRGNMDDKGQLSVDGVNKISQQYFADNPEKIKKANEFTQACSSVNDLPVGDGEEGCDRAALIFKCSIEKASEFDFV